MQRIQVIGAGAVGMLLGSFLAQAGKDVHFVCRRMEQVEALSKGVERENINGTIERFSVKASTTIHQDVDVTIVAVKSKDVAPLLMKLPRTMPVLFVQNGLAHFVAVEEAQLEYYSYASVQFGALKKSDALVSQRGIGVTKLVNEKMPAEVIEMLLDCESEQFPLQLVTDAKKMLYEKAIFNSMINPLTALLDIKNGELLTNPYALKLMEQIYAELAEAFPEYCPKWEEVYALCERTAKNTSSMLADHLSKRKSEVQEIVGVLLHEAKNRKQELHVLQTVYNLVIAKELSGGFKG